MRQRGRARSVPSIVAGFFGPLNAIPSRQRKGHDSHRGYEPKGRDRALLWLVPEVAMKMLAVGACVALILGVTAGSALRPLAAAPQPNAPRIVVEATPHSVVLSE